MAEELLQLDFTIEGVAQLRQTLGIYVSKSRDLRPVWPAVVGLIQEDVKAQFRSKGGSSGGWAKLSSEYASWKSSAFPGRTILIREGKLLKSLVDSKDSLARMEFGRAGMTYGSAHIAAQFHQRGTANMPQRPPVVLRRATQKRIPKLIQEFIFKSGQGRLFRGV